MKLLLYTQYFPPETNALANRWGYFCKYLAQQGHEIYVLTSIPFLPNGEIFSGYQNRFFFEEKQNNLTIIRSGQLIFNHQNLLSRWLSSISFLWSSYYNSFKIPPVDIMIVATPPTLLSYYGFKIALKRNIPMVIDINDLLIPTNFYYFLPRLYFKKQIIKNKLKQVYNQAILLLTSTNALKKEIALNYGISVNKIIFLPNGADVDFFNKEVDSSFVKRQYNLFDTFIVSYVGLLSAAQYPNIIIETALLLKDEQNIKFLIVGTGPLEEKLKIKTKKLKLTNIIFTGFVPHAEVNKYIHASDLCLILYKNDSNFVNNVPSKMFEYMAAQKPIIVNLEGEASRIIQEARAGLVVAPENAEALKGAILKLYNDKFLREKMGLSGLSYVTNNFNKENESRKLEKLIYEIIS